MKFVNPLVWSVMHFGKICGKQHYNLQVLWQIVCGVIGYHPSLINLSSTTENSVFLVLQIVWEQISNVICFFHYLWEFLYKVINTSNTQKGGPTIKLSCLGGLLPKRRSGIIPRMVASLYRSIDQECVPNVQNCSSYCTEQHYFYHFRSSPVYLRLCQAQNRIF